MFVPELVLGRFLLFLCSLSCDVGLFDKQILVALRDGR